MAYTDRELNCRDCSAAFVFTGGEQEFYSSKGLQNDPVRCPSCRAQRKMMRPEDRDDAPSYGVYASWGGRTPRQLHVATCSGCQRSAEVPFIPRGDRPVFCSDCYNEERKRQEAAEAAETEALAARAASGPVVVEVELEGEGPAGDAAEEAADETVEEEEEPRPVVLDPEAVADSTPAPITS
ncbi:MAG: zinc-ribbon domain containing protein [Dehalococcoidia bacterium]